MKTEKATKAATAAHAPASNKMAYTPPQLEVIEMDMEGTVMVASGGGGSLNDFGSGGGLTQQSSVRRSYNSASSSDLEDLINDILTVEQ